MTKLLIKVSFFLMIATFAFIAFIFIDSKIYYDRVFKHLQESKSGGRVTFDGVENYYAN